MDNIDFVKLEIIDTSTNNIVCNQECSIDLLIRLLISWGVPFNDYYKINIKIPNKNDITITSSMDNL